MDNNTPLPGTPGAPKLLDQVANRIRVKGFSIRTEQQYVQWVKRFILFHGKKHPKEMGAPEVEAFLTHLAVEGKDDAVYARRNPPCAGFCGEVQKAGRGAWAMC